MNASGRVVVISNDIVPGMGTPVAAPGLRAFGLAEGLRANGVEVEVLVPGHLARRRWTEWGVKGTLPAAPGTEVVDVRELSGYLEMCAPVACADGTV
jgi:hypothetical protein